MYTLIMKVLIRYSHAFCNKFVFLKLVLVSEARLKRRINELTRHKEVFCRLRNKNRLNPLLDGQKYSLLHITLHELC